jgi:hypothetical protein
MVLEDTCGGLMSEYDEICLVERESLCEICRLHVGLDFSPPRDAASDLLLSGVHTC